EIEGLAIDHVDLVDGALATPEIERARARALPDHGAHGDVVGCPVGVDHLEVEHLHVVALGLQANGLEAALAPAHPDAVSIGTDEVDLLASKIDPSVAIPPLGLRVGGNEPGTGKGNDYRSKTSHIFNLLVAVWVVPKRDGGPRSVMGVRLPDA